MSKGFQGVVMMFHHLKFSALGMSKNGGAPTIDGDLDISYNTKIALAHN